MPGVWLARHMAEKSQVEKLRGSTLARKKIGMPTWEFQLSFASIPWRMRIILTSQAVSAPPHTAEPCESATPSDAALNKSRLTY